jgi:hypothetical protein
MLDDGVCMCEILSFRNENAAKMLKPLLLKEAKIGGPLPMKRGNATDKIFPSEPTCVS